MLPLDGEEGLEFVKGDRSLVGENTVSIDKTLKIDTLLSVNIKVQKVILGIICQLIELLLPLPAELRAGSIRAAHTEGGRVVSALLCRRLHMWSLVFKGHDVLPHDVVLFGFNTA